MIKKSKNIKVFVLFNSIKLLVLYVVGKRRVFATTPSDQLGIIEPPPGVENYGNTVVGITAFISALLRLSAVVAGIWSLFNFIIAGFMYISNQGDSGIHQKVVERFTMTIFGLVVIVASYSIAGLVGLIIFGDANFIISPKITGI